ncbi:MAG: Xaa-Pro peptidase family protein [Candidatus Aenigmatarchaeota archaeon]
MAQSRFYSRRKNLISLMEEKGIEALLLNSRSDLFYYTGIKAENCYLLIPRNSTPCIFRTSLENQIDGAKNLKVFLIRELSEMAKRLKSFKRIGFDEYSTNYYAFSIIKKSGLKLEPSASIIKKPRMVKDEQEIEQIKKSAQITRKAISTIGDISGKKEIEVANRIDLLFRNLGAKNSFDTIVASGRNSAIIHHKPDLTAIKRKSLTIVDAGARLNNYCSDMTRTFCQNPGKKERQIMENISQVQGELIDSIRCGVTYDEIQKKYESLMKSKGYKVMHSFGHGVGISIHERPSKGDILEAGMVITVEPGAYIKNFGGCRKEDMIIIRKGKPKILTI